MDDTMIKTILFIKQIKFPSSDHNVLESEGQETDDETFKAVCTGQRAIRKKLGVNLLRLYDC